MDLPRLAAAIQAVVDASRSMATVDLADVGALTAAVTGDMGDVARASETISRYLAACGATP